MKPKTQLILSIIQTITGTGVLYGCFHILSGLMKFNIMILNMDDQLFTNKILFAAITIFITVISALYLFGYLGIKNIDHGIDNFIEAKKELQRIKKLNQIPGDEHA